MQINLKNLNDVRLFTITISVIAMICSTIFQFIILPYALFQQILFSGSLVALMVAMPMAYFVGLRMMDIYSLTKKLENAVNKDKLTGASTRVNFYQLLERDNDRPMTLIFADIDHFKAINDKYGHKTGDEALKFFAGTLISNCREGDIVARFGGEEFVILLKGTDLDEGIAAANRICTEVRDMSMTIDCAQIQITASFGVAEVALHDEIDTTLHMADLATFRAKREGRDRVCVFDPVLDRDEGFAFVKV